MVYLRVSYGCVGLRFFWVQSSFAPRVGLVYLRLGRVQGFSAFRGLFWLGYILGLVTGFQGLGFFKFRVFSRLGLGRFAYGFVGLMVFQCLELFSGQGISQGQLRLCGVQVFKGLEWFRAQGWLGFLSVGQGLGFFSSQKYFAVRVYLRVSYGCVGFKLFKGLDRVCAQGGLGLFAVAKGLEFLWLGYCLGLIMVVCKKYQFFINVFKY